MDIVKRLIASARLTRLGRDRGGSAAVLFAASLLPIALAVGAAVDYSLANRMQAVLTSSLDAATLSVGIARATGRITASTDADLSARIQQALANNLGSTGSVISSSATATTDASGALSSRASVTFATKFLGMAGVGTWTVNAQSKVSPPGGPIEVAMALDTTGSMAGAKLTGLQQAANALATTLFSTTNASSNVKVGVVPFTYYVNVGLANRAAGWITGAQDYSVPRSACWDTYPNATYSNPVTVNATCSADGAPYDCSYTSYQTVNLGAPVQQCGSWTDTYTWYGCVGSRNYPADLQDQATSGNPVPALLNYGCSSPLLRLTNSLSAVQATINNLSAGGETYIAPGLLWGWRVLSPNAPFADGAA